VEGIYTDIPPSLRPWPAGKKLVKNVKSSRVIRETHATLVWQALQLAAIKDWMI